MCSVFFRSCLFLSYIMNVKLAAFFPLLYLVYVHFNIRFFSLLLLLSSYENLLSRRWNALCTNRGCVVAVVLNLYIHNNIKRSHIKLVLTTTTTRKKITNDHNNHCTKVEWHLNWKHTAACWFWFKWQWQLLCTTIFFVVVI